MSASDDGFDISVNAMLSVNGRPHAGQTTLQVLLNECVSVPMALVVGGSSSDPGCLSVTLALPAIQRQRCPKEAT